MKTSERSQHQYPPRASGYVIAITALLALGAMGLVATASPPQRAQTMHPAEFALRAFCAPIDDSVMVRDGPARTDVWLFSDIPFTTLAERVRKAISSRAALPGGLSFAGWTYMEPTRSYWIELNGQQTVRVFLSRHLDGSLLIIRGAGSARSAGHWAPPYRPPTINLPHGPVR